MKRLSAVAVVTLLLLTASCFRLPSDEKVLRRAFSIPDNVRLLKLDAPTPGGWFGREGLEITATFTFESDQFERYRRGAMESGKWKPMPIEREMLLKILGVASYRQALERMNEEYRQRGETKWIHDVPSEDEVLALWKPPRLPLDVKQGLFRCLTAGNNLMYAKKRECVDKAGDGRRSFEEFYADAGRPPIRNISPRRQENGGGRLTSLLTPI